MKPEKKWPAARLIVWSYGIGTLIAMALTAIGVFEEQTLFFGFHWAEIKIEAGATVSVIAATTYSAFRKLQSEYDEWVLALNLFPGLAILTVAFVMPKATPLFHSVSLVAALFIFVLGALDDGPRTLMYGTLGGSIAFLVGEIVFLAT